MSAVVSHAAQVLGVIVDRLISLLERHSAAELGETKPKVIPWPRPVVLLAKDGRKQAFGKIVHADYVVEWDDGDLGRLRDTGEGKDWRYLDNV